MTEFFCMWSGERVYWLIREKNTKNLISLVCLDYDCGLTCSVQTNITWSLIFMGMIHVPEEIYS